MWDEGGIALIRLALLGTFPQGKAWVEGTERGGRPPGGSPFEGKAWVPRLFSVQYRGLYRTARLSGGFFRQQNRRKRKCVSGG